MVHRSMMPVDNVILFTCCNNKEGVANLLLNDRAGGVVRPKKF